MVADGGKGETERVDFSAVSPNSNLRPLDFLVADVDSFFCLGSPLSLCVHSTAAGGSMSGDSSRSN